MLPTVSTSRTSGRSSSRRAARASEKPTTGTTKPRNPCVFVVAAVCCTVCVCVSCVCVFLVCVCVAVCAHVSRASFPLVLIADTLRVVSLRKLLVVDENDANARHRRTRPRNSESSKSGSGNSNGSGKNANGGKSSVSNRNASRGSESGRSASDSNYVSGKSVNDNNASSSNNSANDNCVSSKSANNVNGKNASGNSVSSSGSVNSSSVQYLPTRRDSAVATATAGATSPPVQLHPTLPLRPPMGAAHNQPRQPATESREVGADSLPLHRRFGRAVRPTCRRTCEVAIRRGRGVDKPFCHCPPTPPASYRRTRRRQELRRATSTRPWRLMASPVPRRRLGLTPPAVQRRCTVRRRCPCRRRPCCRRHT